MDNNESKAEPFDVLLTVYKVMQWLGYYKLLNPPKNQFIVVLHKIYRIFALVVMVFLYNVLHLAFVVQMYMIGDMDNVFEGLIVLVPILNLFSKVVNMNLGSKKLDELKKLLQDPIFGATNKKDEEYLTSFKNTTSKMWSVLVYALTVNLTFWTMQPLFKRLQDPNTITTASYQIMDSKSWKGFCVNWVVEVGPVFWVGYGHIFIDYIIVMYYYQIVTQLRIINNNLENLVNDVSNTTASTRFVFKDEMDPNIQKRFIHYVNRYERVIWFTQGVNEVFSKAISFQLFSSSCCTCVGIFRISNMSPMSVPFLFLITYFIVINSQVFVYCYFGELIRAESGYVATAVYLSDWVSLSPRLRRQLLLAMGRWSHPINPTVSYVVPLTLTTFMTIVRSIYTLFTALKTTNNYLN